jgi:undecaprenyl-diphosphatase
MSSEIIHSVFLGIVQGLGEFLPISSTAHLILVPYFFGWPDPGLAFDVALHLGTLIAVLAYFWKDWLIIIYNSKFLISNQIPNPKTQVTNYNSKTLLYIIVATIPGALIGYLLESQAETVFRQPLLIALVLAVFGLVLFLADKFSANEKSIDKIGWGSSLLIGLSQAIAIIPGVSRSGATIAAGRLLKLNRESAARFSFLLSTPIIFGAVILKASELIKNLANPAILMAVFFSAVSGYLAIKYLLKLITGHSYAVFFWYRLALATAVAIFFIFQNS